MKFVVISDTHGRHKKVDVPDGDVLIHCGDMVAVGRQNEYFKFGKWFRDQPHQYKVLVPGNHDRLFQKNWHHARALMEQDDASITVLHDSEVTLDGVRIYGTAWQPFFYDWAFNVKSLERRRELMARIPEGIDILVTHCPPEHILDVPGGYGPEENVGCTALAERVVAVKPKFHCFGHIHHSNGIRSVGGTTYINAAICDESYKPTQPSYTFRY